MSESTSDKSVSASSFSENQADQAIGEATIAHLLQGKKLDSFFHGEHGESIKGVLNERICRRTTLLHFAVLINSKHAVKELLDYGADVNIRDSFGLVPLHYTRSFKVAKLLISKGADVNAEDRHGENILTRAFIGGRIDLVRDLLRFTDVNPENTKQYCGLELNADKYRILEEMQRESEDECD